MNNVLIVGATGMLGRALVVESKKIGLETIGLSRQGSDIDLDIVDSREFEKVLRTLKPKVVINASARTSVDDCEMKPEYAYMVNSRPVAVLPKMSEEMSEIGLSNMKSSSQVKLIEAAHC